MQALSLFLPKEISSFLASLLGLLLNEMQAATNGWVGEWKRKGEKEKERDVISTTHPKSDSANVA